MGRQLVRFKSWSQNYHKVHIKPGRFTPVIHVMTVTAIAGMLIESKSHHARHAMHERQGKGDHH